MSIGIRFRRGLLALAILAALATPVHAFFENIYSFEGVLGSVQDRQITVVNESNTVVPILVPPDQKLDPQLLVGQRVWVELEPAEFGMWKLRRILRLDPNLPLTPAR